MSFPRYVGGVMYRVVAPIAAAALAAFVVACGEEEAAFEAAETPTVSPSATTSPDAALTPTPSPQPTPSAGGKAPDGCLSSELAYVDPEGRFAFCYPKDMELTTVDTGEGTAPTVMHPLGEMNRVVANFGWTAEGRVGAVPGAPCFQSLTSVKNEQLRRFDFAGKTTEACFQDHFDPTRTELLLYKSMDVEVPTGTLGVVQVSITYSGPDWARQGVPVEEIATRILNSAVIF